MDRITKQLLPAIKDAPPPSARQRVTLGLGAVLIADTPSIVRTVLGSCVAVILHVPRLRISLLCHAQMPEKQPGKRCFEDCPDPCYEHLADTDDLKYVPCCLRFMLDELARRWVVKREIIATLVGGGNVIRNIDPRWSVAARNVRIAKELLEEQGITIAYSDTGGVRGRVIEHISDKNLTSVRYHDPA